jgi:hypothetical protein
VTDVTTDLDIHLLFGIIHVSSFTVSVWKYSANNLIENQSVEGWITLVIKLWATFMRHKSHAYRLADAFEVSASEERLAL